MKKLLVTIFALTATSASASDYNLFNPVPDDKLRPFTTERPSKTDSVFTIDSGHLVIESSLFNYIHNNDGNAEYQKYTAGSGTVFRLGLTQSLDAQVIVDGYNFLSSKDAGTKDHKNGLGDTTLRLKYNIMGNDGGNLGLATLAYVKLPTNEDDLGNDAVEGGIELPFNYNLPDNWSIGGMTQLQFLDQQNAYANMIILNKGFTADLSGYTEIYTYKTDDAPQWQNTLDFGLVYAVNDRFHIDTGINFGISQAADDVNYFVGAAYRF